jgi:hypothetical protein
MVEGAGNIRGDCIIANRNATPSSGGKGEHDMVEWKRFGTGKNHKQNKFNGF